MSRLGKVRSSNVKRLMPLTLAAIVTLLSLGGIVTLIWHARALGTADEVVDRATVTFEDLQGAPWRPLVPGSFGAAGVRAQTVAEERLVLQRLGELSRSNRIPELTAAGTPLRRNFALLTAALALIGKPRGPAAHALGSAQYQSYVTAMRLLQATREAYRTEAGTALLEAAIGSAAIVLLLLLAFARFYRRNQSARESAEAMAEELSRSTAHLREAQRLARVGSWQLDLITGRVRWSPELSRLHGWPRDEVPASLAERRSLVAPEDWERVINALRQAVAHGGPFDLEYRTAAGRLMYLQGVPVRDGTGTVTGMMGTCQDITERARRAEAERANSAKTEFISRMSHELRTPLNAILGFSQLMQGSELPEIERTNVSHIIKAGEHLLELVNEVLDISRIESGQLHLSFGPVNVSEIIEQTIDLVTPAAAARRIALHPGVEDQDVCVLGDAQRLKQVLLNLLSNAIKYNRDGGHVSVAGTRTADGHVRIVVADDGPGIPTGQIERLFSPFERLGAEGSSVEGTGLGLALSRGMVEAMGGTIRAHSVMGHGAAFTVCLPEATPLAPAGKLAVVPSLEHAA